MCNVGMYINRKGNRVVRDLFWFCNFPLFVELIKGILIAQRAQRNGRGGD